MAALESISSRNTRCDAIIDGDYSRENSDVKSQIVRDNIH